MNWFQQNLGIFPAMIEALVHKPDTTTYPFTPIELSPHFRGALQFNPENCKGCGLCVRDCPAQALELVRHNRNSFTFTYNPARCTYCGQCEERCHNQAIYLTNQLVDATTTPDNLIQVLKDT